VTYLLLYYTYARLSRDFDNIYIRIRIHYARGESMENSCLHWPVVSPFSSICIYLIYTRIRAHVERTTSIFKYDEISRVALSLFPCTSNEISTVPPTRVVVFAHCAIGRPVITIETIIPRPCQRREPVTSALLRMRVYVLLLGTESLTIKNRFLPRLIHSSSPLHRRYVILSSVYYERVLGRIHYYYY